MQIFTRRTFAVTALAAVGLGLVPISPAVAAPATATLTDREWRLQVPGVSSEVFNLAHLTIARNGSFTGADGCNQVTGTASLDASTQTVTFSNVVWTQRACRFVAEVGNAYVQASATMEELLDGSATYQVRGRTATLTSDAAAASTWATTMPIVNVQQKITDHQWHLSIDGMAPDRANKAWFSISPDGQVSGSDGCNRIMGSATIDQASGEISFGPLGSTRMACFQTDEQAELDAQLVRDTLHAALTGESSYIATGSRLVLIGADGTRTTFVR